SVCSPLPGGDAREAVLREGVAHAVVVDGDGSVKQSYGVKDLPTLVFVDPDGNAVGASPGEPDPEPLEEVIRALIAQARKKGVPLATSPLPLRPERPDEPAP